MDRRFLYLISVIVVILLIILAWQDAKKQQPSPLDKLNVTPTLSFNFNPQASQVPQNQVTPTITQDPLIQVIQNATPGAFTELEEGVKYQDVSIGTGEEVKTGNTITVHYKGILENGVKFDSSYDRRQPFETQIGVGKVIQGWDLGVIGMKAGGKRILIIPSPLGYGNQQAGSIPPNSTLIFEVELLAVK